MMVIELQALPEDHHQVLNAHQAVALVENVKLAKRSKQTMTALSQLQPYL